VEEGGFHLDVGARAGAEIQFGFIGIPQLSLQGDIGLRIENDSVDAKDKGTNLSYSQNQTTIGTVSGTNPWEIFTANVAALYYF
jgi:hypothetical protein